MMYTNHEDAPGLYRIDVKSVGGTKVATGLRVSAKDWTCVGVYPLPVVL
jgi:hypothetical protein